MCRCLVFCALIFAIEFHSAVPIEVTTTLGIVRGTKLESRLGATFNAFRGIRYAAAPVGELRFQNPRPVPSWAPDIYDATQDGPNCPQHITANFSDISEDCLRINVYTRDVKQSKPVIVYLHPGGFYAGSVQSNSFAGPQHFMDRDIVFVTVNYRLGTLGFLATGTAAAPGNAGLKDQVLALRWLQQHIASFGGDSKSITLLGYSAGSLSIGLHMASPMSKGLFHRAIAMSASPLGQFRYEARDLRLAAKQAKLLNCPTEPIKAMIDCMRTKPMMEYAKTTEAMFDFNWNPVLNWYPVIESDFGQERFLIEDPNKSFLSGNIYKVPLITGITEYEFVSMAYYALRNESVRTRMNEHFDTYAPIAFLYERDSTRSMKISAALHSHYLRNSSNLKLPESLKPLGELYSDALIGFEFHRFTTLAARHVPVYMYFFRYKGRYSHFAEHETFRPVHHDELIYLLYIPYFQKELFKSTDPENNIIERLTRICTEFARKSDPNNPNDQYLQHLNWRPYSKETKDYLEIGKELNSKTGGIYQQRFELWDQLFPISELN